MAHGSATDKKHVDAGDAWRPSTPIPGGEWTCLRTPRGNPRPRTFAEYWDLTSRYRKMEVGRRMCWGNITAKRWQVSHERFGTKVSWPNACIKFSVHNTCQIQEDICVVCRTLGQKLLPYGQIHYGAKFLWTRTSESCRDRHCEASSHDRFLNARSNAGMCLRSSRWECGADRKEGRGFLGRDQMRFVWSYMVCSLQDGHDRSVWHTWVNGFGGRVVKGHM